MLTLSETQVYVIALTVAVPIHNIQLCIKALACVAHANTLALYFQTYCCQYTPNLHILQFTHTQAHLVSYTHHVMFID